MEDYYDDSDFVCNACQCELETSEKRVNHYRSEWHRYNVKRRCAELPPIPEAFFLEKFNQLRKAKQEADENAVKVWKCEYTNKEFKSEAAYKHYLNTKDYKKAQLKYERKVAIAKELGVSVENLPKKEQRPLDQPIAVLYDLFSPEGPFESVKKLLDYMLFHHGFFVPFVDYLVDIEGLLEYLGYKIGVGHQCIFCHATFVNCEAVQKHMVSKGHCMFSLQDETGEEDMNLLEFYEFSHNIEYLDDDEIEDEDFEEDFEEELDEDGQITTIQHIPRLTREQRKKLREQQRYRTVQLLGLRTQALVDEDSEGNYSMALTVPTERKRQLKDMNDKEELILTDGTLIGHRQHNRQYKKKSGNVNITKSVRSELMAKYFALRMPGYVAQEEQAFKQKQSKDVHRYHMSRHIAAGLRQNLILRKHFRSSNSL